MKLDLEAFQKMGAEIQEEFLGLTTEQITKKLTQAHIEAVKQSVDCGYYFNRVVETKGAKTLSARLQELNESDVLAHAAIKVYKEAEKIASMGTQDSDQFFLQIGKSKAFKHYLAIAHVDLSNSLIGEQP